MTKLYLKLINKKRELRWWPLLPASHEYLADRILANWMATLVPLSFFHWGGHGDGFFGSKRCQNHEIQWWQAFWLKSFPLALFWHWRVWSPRSSAMACSATSSLAGATCVGWRQQWRWRSLVVLVKREGERIKESGKECEREREEKKNLSETYLELATWRVSDIPL